MGFYVIGDLLVEGGYGSGHEGDADAGDGPAGDIAGGHKHARAPVALGGELGLAEVAMRHAAADAPVDWLGQGHFWGSVIMNALHLYPILYMNVAAALSHLDPAMEQAAQNLGCPPWKRLFKITLPLTMPGIFAGGAIVFIWSFTEA